MNSIIVRNLVKKYRTAEKNAVDDISFEVKEGSFFSLLGPNGAGKTTTISILTTTLSKTSGEIEIAGYNLDTHQTQIRQSVGIIFQNPSLDKNLTAEENIRLHTNLYGLYPFRPFYGLMPKAYRHRVEELAEVLDIAKDMQKPIKTFSGGMKRKLEIIRSLMHKPKVIFLDEPTSGLDPLSRNNLWEYLVDVRKREKTTVFLTTHYLEEAEGSDMLCIINNGKIVAEGTPSDIKKKIIKEYIIVDANDRGKLKKELHGKKYPTEEVQGELRIILTNLTAQEVIRSIDTPLSRLVTHIPTLDEAYLEIIAHDTNNHEQATS